MDLFQASFNLATPLWKHISNMLLVHHPSYSTSPSTIAMEGGNDIRLGLALASVQPSHEFMCLKAAGLSP
jgi:hypothetical protein